jgi:hypothetical protein
MAGPLAALGGLASFGGLLEMAKSTFEAEGKLYDMSIATGVAGQQLAGWHFAAERAHVDADQFDRSLTMLNKNLGLVAAHTKGSKEIATILSRMGIHGKDLNNTSAVLAKISDQVKHLVDTHRLPMAEALLSKLMGARVGGREVQLFAEGNVEILKQIQEAIDSGLAPSDEDIKKGKEFEETYKRLDAAVQGLKFSIGNAIFPELEEPLTELTGWFKDNRKWIAGDIREGVKELKGSLKGVFTEENIEAFGRDLKTVGTDIRWVVDEVGGARNAILLLVGIKFYPLLKELALITAGVAKMGLKFIWAAAEAGKMATAAEGAITTGTAASAGTGAAAGGIRAWMAGLAGAGGIAAGTAAVGAAYAYAYGQFEERWHDWHPADYQRKFFDPSMEGLAGAAPETSENPKGAAWRGSSLATWGTQPVLSEFTAGVNDFGTKLRGWAAELQTPQKIEQVITVRAAPGTEVISVDTKRSGDNTGSVNVGPAFMW